MTAHNNHSPGSTDEGRERRGRIPCWLSEFSKVIEAVAAGPRSRSSRASEMVNDHHVKSWFIG